MPFSNDWGDYLPNENNYLVYFINPNIHIWLVVFWEAIPSIREGKPKTENLAHS